MKPKTVTYPYTCYVRVSRHEEGRIFLCRMAIELDIATAKHDEYNKSETHSSREVNCDNC
jgi:hypothetical protein